MGMFSRSSRSKSSLSPTDAIDNKKRDSSNRVVGKKDKHSSSSSSSSSSSPSPSVSQVPSLAPPVFNKHETQDLHMGHKPITTSNKYKNSTPVHNDPDRPSTTLMAKKQQQREKLQQQKKNQQPINSVTSSTALWTATAINNSQHSEAVSTGEYYEEVIVTDIDDDDEEYDDDFFELVEEEVVEVYDGTNRVDHVVDAVIDGDESTQVQEQHQVIEEEELLDRKITIRFDEYDEMQTCIHINDYTKHEISRSWYKRDDYDKMVDLARKTASKAVQREKELQNELENMLLTNNNNNNKGKGKGDHDDDLDDDDHNEKENSNNNKRSTKQSRKKPIEYRGLEAWTPDGSAKVRMLKESAIELVWNEQSRQWEEGTFDDVLIRNVYITVSEMAVLISYNRGINDADLVQKLIEQEEIRSEKKKNRNRYSKSKSVIRRTAKSTGKGLVSGTNKIVSRTGKVGKKLGKRGVKAGVATATLDPRMMKEALKVRIVNKRRECQRETIVTQSRSSTEQQQQREVVDGAKKIVNNSPPDRGHSESANSTGHQQEPGGEHIDSLSTATGEHPDYGYGDTENDDNSAGAGSYRSNTSNGSRTHSYASVSSATNKNSKSSSNNGGKRKKSKLKLLGVVPIPGTKKVYKEERREKRAEKRVQNMSRRPSWEAGISTGKY